MLIERYAEFQFARRCGKLIASLLGWNLTQRREGAKKTDGKWMIATAATGFPSSPREAPLRLSTFA
jgi:hypothetical protein